MKYIDADKLLAEIKRLHKAHSGKYGCDEVGLNLEYLEDFITSTQQEPLANMIQWTGNNLKEVIDFTGKSLRFGEWFKSWEEYENYVHSHNDILKLFCEDGSHYEVPVGAWIVKTPDGYNVPSVAKYVQQRQPEIDLDNHTIMEEIRKCGCNPNEFDVARHFFELGLSTRRKE